jgi:cytochrome c biogenesis protein
MAPRTRDDLVERPGHELDTQPQESEVPQPKIGFLGLLRWMWRQLTSMRTALFLLLLLAIGAIPGSIWPQRNIDAGRVSDYLSQHTVVGPWLDRLGFFDVYSSPWFAAIYLLLFVSLVGCIIPRSRLHWKAMRAQPPKAPRRLERLSAHQERVVVGEPEQVVAAARAVLRRKRYRLRPADPVDPASADTVAAESGYLRETGNLVFHIALVVVIIAVALGHLLGWRGDVIVPEGQTFSNTVSSYDTIDPGPWVNPESLKPFSVRVQKLDVSFEDQAGGAQFGQPRGFTAHTLTRDEPGAPVKEQKLEVNGPLSLGGASVFLLGNGYAPVITVRDAKGRVVYSQATPFLPQDNNYRSVGAVKVPGGDPEQLGFFGFFLPTLEFDKEQGPISSFPDLDNPALVLGVYKGDLYPGGRPQSVYTLDTDEMTQVKGADGQPLRLLIKPGQTIKLPDGLGSITLDKVVRFAGISIRHDPGKMLALWGSLIALAGLIASLTIRRRRVFVRVRPAEPETAGAGPDGSAPPGPRTLVSIGGLAKGEDPRLADALDHVLDAIAERTGSTS